MELSDFQLIKTIGTGPLDWEFFADVNVTTGALWWKKTERRRIRRKFAGCWHFVDTGRFTPDLQAETLERAAEAQRMLQS